jgi:hypothetical protein
MCFYFMDEDCCPRCNEAVKLLIISCLKSIPAYECNILRYTNYSK